MMILSMRGLAADHRRHDDHAGAGVVVAVLVVVAVVVVAVVVVAVIVFAVVPVVTLSLFAVLLVFFYDGRSLTNI
jgi:fatty acid desaturase